MIKIVFVCDWCGREQPLCFKDKNVYHRIIWNEVVPFFGKTIKGGKHDPFCGENCQKASEMSKEIAIHQKDVFHKELHGKTIGELRAIRDS